jgi:excisionase family DNA binding protein
VRRAWLAFDEVGHAWLDKQNATAANGNAATTPSPGEASSDQWIGTNEAAELLDVRPRRVRQLAEEGALRGRQRGKRWLFARQDVLSLRELRDAA